MHKKYTMPETTSISLLELNAAIKNSIKLSFSAAVWVRAEISELHEKDHAYFELVEKDSDSDRIVAKTKAVCWAPVYRMLKSFFETSTSCSLAAGMQVLVACVVEYHEVYGISLNIRDINPSYTVGDLAKQRIETLRRLQSEGVIDMNKSLEFPPLPQRIAVISSESAAGYGDFMHQLTNNTHKLAFYTKLFPSIVQGDTAAVSILNALDKIYQHHEKFDAVVIIRGGGATTDLHCFNSYNLATHCAQFPLPVIVGIGHLRDETVLDTVAYASLKTPTATAEFLLEKMKAQLENLLYLEEELTSLAGSQIKQEFRQLQQLGQNLSSNVRTAVRAEKFTIINRKNSLNNKIQIFFDKQQHRLEFANNTIKLSSPVNLMKKGYTFTTKNGEIVKSKILVEKGDELTTHFHDGEITSIVK